MSTGSNAPLDENSRAGLYGLSSANDGTRVDVWVNPDTHAVLVDGGLTPATATTWGGSGGNTKTITNSAVTSTSMVVFMWATPPAGLWSVVCGSGTFTITSSDSESSSLAFTYKVFA